MVTGASTADVAIVLVDARHGVRRADARHAFIAVAARHPAPRGRRQQDGPRRLRRGALRRDRPRLLRLPPLAELARRGASSRSARSTATTSSTARDAMPWYGGAPLLDAPRGDRPGRRPQPRADLRFPVQWVIRAEGRRLPRLRRPGRLRRRARRRRGRRAALRACESTVRGGRDARRRRSTRPSAPQSVTVRLADDVDVSRGDVLVPRRRTRRSRCASSRPTCAGSRDAPAAARRALPAQAPHRTTVDAVVDEILDAPRRPTRWTAARRRPSWRSTTSAACGCACAARSSPTRTRVNRATGAFILIDEATNDTVAGGHGRLVRISVAPSRGQTP